MPRIYVCHGKDCRSARGFEGLCAAVGDHEHVACQKVCDGPVAGVAIGGRLQWFEKLRTPRRWRAVVEAAATGAVPDALRKRRKKKRAGKLRTR